MSWEEHYRKQAKAHRQEAHAYAINGKHSKAKFHIDAAEIYEELAEKAKSGEVRPESC